MVDQETIPLNEICLKERKRSKKKNDGIRLKNEFHILSKGDPKNDYIRILLITVGGNEESEDVKQYEVKNCYRKG